jgi:predicted metal-dependent hydrolase
MNLVEKSFELLYPDKNIAKYNFSLTYSGRFSAYNGHVKYGLGNYKFVLSNKWLNVSEEIQIGIIQHLMQKVFKTKNKTLHQDLYESFIKNVHIAIPKDKVSLELKDSFERVNDKYFLGMVEMPNLVFGKKSFRKMGSYEYASDTITISHIFYNISEENKILLDYVMFHEMLHKIHKFKTVNNRSMHHSRKFKLAEKEFDGAEKMEKALSKFVSKKKFKHLFGLY